jgi:hypothetical protein
MVRRGAPVVRILAATASAALLALALTAVAAACAAGSGPTTSLVSAGVEKAGARRAGGQEPEGKPQAKPKKDPLAKLALPWPSLEELEERRVEAENLPLFKSHDPLSLTITGDIGAINRDRNPESDKRFPGTVSLEAEGGQVRSLPVVLSTRGHSRLNVRTCDAAPLKLDFVKKDLAGTVLEGQGELKLVTHCRTDDDHEQHVLSEYLVYRLFNLFTPRSFRARLVKVTYVDDRRQKRSPLRYGMLLEEDDDVARRLGGRVAPLPKRLFRQLDQGTLVLMALLQYAIGNTDYSIYALHNVELVQVPNGTLYTVPYDFDYSGLVNAPYAAADRALGITSVRQRLYRGPCLTVPELEPFLAAIRPRKDEVLGLLDVIPDLRGSQRDDVLEYLKEFFAIIENPGRTKRALVDSCQKKAGM